MDKQAILKAQLYSPEYPWNNSKDEEIGPAVMKFMEDHEPFYRRWAETWFNNFQFLYGNQSVRWSRRYGYAVDVDFMQRLPAMNMRSQTNIARVVAEALSSLIYANLPEWAVETSEQSSVKGKRFKRIVQKLLDAYMQRLCMDKEFSNAAMIYVVFGQFAACIDWDFSGGKLLEIPRWNKIQAPVFTDYMAPNPITQGLLNVPVPILDSNGQPLFEERWEAQVDQMGRQIIDKVFAGDVKFDVLTPFEYRREIGSGGMHKTKYVERIRLIDYDQWVDEYDDVQGKTRYYKQVKPVYQNPAVYRIAVRHFMRMQFTTPPGLNDIYQRPENVYRSSLFKNKVLVVEHFDKPHPVKWPMGRRVIVANGDCTHITVPSYNTNKLDGWHPFVEAQWMNIAPNHLSSGPMNDVVQKNRELNVADSLIATAMRRNMGSQLVIKTGSGVDPQRFTGEPGIVHEVPDPFGMRWLHDDMPLPPVLPKLRDMAKQDIYETSGAMDALRGDRSKGVSAGYALKQLQEREEKRLTPARKRFEYAVAGGGEKIYACLKTNVVRLDDQVMGYMMRAAAGEFQEQDVIALLTSTVDFGVEINIEEASMAMKSKATQQATVSELGQNPAVAQRLQQDPKVLDDYLKFFDVETLRDRRGIHIDRAQRENEIFSDILRLGPDMEGLSRPIVLFQDDDDIHMQEHEDFMLQNSDEITKNEAFLQYLLIHIETHRIQKQEKLGQQMPGTALQVPNMMSSVRQSATPTTMTIFQKNMADQQQLQQSQQANKAVQQMGKPQAPTQPTAPGGPKVTNPQAPSQVTPQGGPGQ